MKAYVITGAHINGRKPLKGENTESEIVKIELQLVGNGSTKDVKDVDITRCFLDNPLVEIQAIQSVKNDERCDNCSYYTAQYMYNCGGKLILSGFGMCNHNDNYSYPMKRDIDSCENFDKKVDSDEKV